jgi:ribosomal-protein-alanine N-acetyltransferase
MYRTARLVLRGWREEDLDPFAALCADVDVMEFFPSTLSADESEAMVNRISQRMRDDGFGLWVVEVDGVFAGYTGLNSAASMEGTSFTPCVEVGWRLAKWAWGKGYASEAARESLRIGFEEHQLHSIFSWTTHTNARSESVMRHIGMARRPDLDFDHPNTPNWWGQPHIVYSLERSAWAEYGM